MKNNYDEKVKGHGYFRKTKAFGLASGIVLGAALIFFWCRKCFCR